ncbi:hypothetical protein Mapa_015051 [Marchantia paleacea]|nr:hypothetical protein Mapa_015051 [Marchantia paleacea]
MMGMKKQERRKGSVMHKSQLQEYAQKAAILPPVYEFVKEGASHEPRFKCIVILNGVSYESPPGFPNLKSAEHAAAKVALDALQQTTDGTGVSPSPVHESGLCKNLLQEYAQKNSLPLPVYQSTRAGEDHAPTFTSSVEIAGVKYSGGSAKNKKEAEIKAAKTALLAIQSALASAVEADVPVASPTKPQVGLSTFIDSQINNSGRKRGRGAQASSEENTARRLKMEETPTTAKTSSEIPALATPAKTDSEDSAQVTTSTTKPIKSAKKKATAAERALQMEAAAQDTPATTNKEAAEAEPAGKAVEPSAATPVVTKSVAIADLLATPTAQKILGVL